MNTYAEEVHKSEQVAYLNKDIGNQCQNLTEIQCNELLKLLQKSEELSDVTLCTWKIDLADFELKMGVEPICSIPHPVPKVH